MIRLSSICVQGIYPAIVPITLSPLKQINLLIGSSGSGKSLLLKVIRSALLPASASCDICVENAFDNKPIIKATYEWNNRAIEISFEVKPLRGNLVISPPKSNEPLPEEFILSHEKIRPLFSASDRFIDYKCDEIKASLADASAIFRNTMFTYADEIEQSLIHSVEEMCENYSFQVKPVFDWDKAISFQPSVRSLPGYPAEEYPFSALSAGQKKHLILNFILEQASSDRNNPILLDDFEAFLDKPTIDSLIGEMLALDNQFFVVTRSAYVVNKLRAMNAAIFFSDPRFDEKRRCQSDLDEYTQSILV